MPELPEVETMRRGILPVSGSRIEEIEQLACPLKPILLRPPIGLLRERVIGRQIREILRVGKRVVLRLDSDDSLIFEPRMTGLVLLADPAAGDRLRLSHEHFRIRLQLSGGPVSQLWYWDRRGLGSVYLLDPHQFATRLGGKQLGPDALQMTAEQLRQRLGASRRAIKVALLDQRALAGVGNLYAAEILHVAHIHPATRCTRLRSRDWQALHAALHDVLELAIRYEGSTLADGTYRNVLNQSGSYQNHHRVYARADEVCRSCQVGVVERIVQAQRATFLCPVCQPRNRRNRRGTIGASTSAPSGTNRANEQHPM